MPIPADHANAFIDAILIMATRVHENAVEKGFWPRDSVRNPGEMIALMHSELSEMLEALRTPSHPRSEKIPDFTHEEEEAADLLIRLMDYSVARDIRLGEAVIAKHGYNQTRPLLHGKNF